MLHFAILVNNLSGLSSAYRKQTSRWYFAGFVCRRHCVCTPICFGGFFIFGYKNFNCEFSIQVLCMHPVTLAYSIPIFGIKYWNEVICKAFQLRQHMHPLYSIQWWLLFWFFFYFDGESIIEQSKRTTSTNTSIYIVPVVCSSFIPLCGALIAFTINPSCIVCTANTIETNRKKQFFFILLGKIVATPRNQNGLFSHINTM